LIATFTHPDDRVRVRTETLAAALIGAPLAIEFRILRRDGTMKWVQLTSSSVSADAAGSVRVGVMIDITERRRADAMRLERDRAEAANRAKTDFLSLVSHELRTPLNAILGFSQLLARDPTLQPKHQMWTHEMLTSGRHLLGLVEDILDLSGAQSGRLSLQCAAVDLHRIVEEAWAMLASDAARSALVFVDRIDAASPWIVVADPKRLKQVLTNLLSNAIKYNKPGGSVTLDAARLDKAIEFCIADTGVGMDADQCARAFNPFERLSASRSDVAATGLGLALSKQLVEAMHGSIRVDSEPGTGSVFTVTLPSPPP
jgi:signal transduction histidine kinase